MCSSNLLAKLLKHGCSWHLLNPERCVWLRPATRHGASLCHFGIERCCREGGIEELCCCGGTAVSAPWILSYSYTHTDIYIYTGPLFWSFLLPESGKVVFFKSRGLLGIQVKNNEELVRYSNKHFALHDNISHNYTNAYTSYSISGSLFSCASALSQDVLLHIGLIRIEPICRLLRQQCKFVAWICLGQIVGGQNRLSFKPVEFWCSLNSAPRSWKFQMMKHWFS